jgi:D-alanyl-D-alanine endopeptidase (penicillin-binding protein 7)
MQRLLALVVFSAFFAGNVLASEGSELARNPSMLRLASDNVLVLDTHSGQPIYSKNADDVTPIASITKLMTAMLVIDANQSLDQEIEITLDDVDTLRHSHSRVPVGARLPRGQLLHLALMSSDNRAAHALARAYPGGVSSIVTEMNSRAAMLGMNQTRFREPTGLSDENVSTAKDLAKMVKAASQYELIQRFTTDTQFSVAMRPSGRLVEFHNTNALTKSDNWDIRVSKTGYIQEAGRCLVMMAKIASRDVAIVLLDSMGSHTRTADAIRVKYWLETGKSMAVSKARSSKRHRKVRSSANRRIARSDSDSAS